MSPVWTSAEPQPNAKGDTLDDFREAIRAVWEGRGAVYLDGKAAIPNYESYFADGVHPNERGHRAMGSFLLHRLGDLGWLNP